MGIFNNEIQDNYKSDYGFTTPRRTSKECTSPVFADKKLHRIAIVKDEHFGSVGDRDEGGISGWRTKHVCTGCGKEWQGGFYVDKQKLNR